MGGRRERFMRCALVAGLLVAGALHVVNPDDLIVRTNASMVGHARAAAGRTVDGSLT
ncbi:MAG TPA: hypothetical protein VEQ42_11935 [Pyrinomonadaceae bacterium]|nr:hypothetical protein [Pyrinomonadaceae bacterium]